MSALIDLTGQTFGRLTVLARAENDADNRARWLCACVCGGTATIGGKSLRSGNSQSCGCAAREAASRACKAKARHGMWRTPEYRAWQAIRQRCENAKGKDYHRYGGRGICVCERWQTFENFYDDMGPRPTSRHSIERENNNGDYEPSNCHWALPVEQQSNRRCTVRLTYNGRTQTLAQWSREIGISRGALRLRVDRGWPLERALSP